MLRAQVAPGRRLALRALDPRVGAGHRRAALSRFGNPAMHPLHRPRLAAAALALLFAVAPAAAEPSPESSQADPPQASPNEVSPLEVRPPSAEAAAIMARGETLAAARCAGCHSVNTKGASPYRAAPPFRELPPVPPHALQTRLRVLLGKPHYGMPQQFLTLSEAQALAAFIESVKKPAPGDRRLRAWPCIATAC